MPQDGNHVCSACGVHVPEDHIRARYVMDTPQGLLCAACVSRTRMRLRTAAVPDQIDPRRAAWVLSSLSTGVLALWLISSKSFLDLAVGLFFLMVTTGMVFFKVFDAEVF